MLLNDLGDKVFGYSNYMWWDATRILTATSLISCLLFAIFAYTYDRSIGALISWVRGSTD
jgi:hypothetical protein